MGVIFKNNVMYGAGDIEISPVCYSEEEREVGCWTDGKPLYQKTVIWDNPTLGRVDNLPHGLENVEHIHMTNWQFGVIFGFESTDTSYWANIFNVTSTGVSYRIGGAWGSGAKPLIITFQYTKTTDTPGSGIWTPSGVPAVHYSTDEQIVGTWIDGSPLYQLTINVPNFSANQYDERISKSYYAYLDIAAYVPNPSHVFCDIGKSFITLQDSTTRTPIYADWQDGTSIAIFFPYVARTGTLTLTMEYTKSSS